MERVLESAGKKDFGVLENPGIWSLQVLESRGGKSIFMSVRTLFLALGHCNPLCCR